MEIFVAFTPYRFEIRSYVGSHNVSETLLLGEALRAEARKLSISMGLPEPGEARVASTYMGVTLICDISYRPPNSYQRIIDFAKHNGWKISRK